MQGLNTARLQVRLPCASLLIATQHDVSAQAACAWVTTMTLHHNRSCLQACCTIDGLLSRIVLAKQLLNLQQLSLPSYDVRKLLLVANTLNAAVEQLQLCLAACEFWTPLLAGQAQLQFAAVRKPHCRAAATTRECKGASIQTLAGELGA